MGDEAVQGVVGVRLWRGGGWEDGCVVFCWVMEIGGGGGGCIACYWRGEEPLLGC